MKIFIPLAQAGGDNRPLSGNKAAALADMINHGINVPPGLCVTINAYRTFINATELRGKLALELGRKRFEEMRWEEMWDAALRIRNLFLATPMPAELAPILTAKIAADFSAAAVAVRSSSLAEDQPGASFAGLHESFLNIKGVDNILRHIRLVWASLWSDAALLYRQELALDIDTSAMAVIIQQMIPGDKSGVSFGRNPNNQNQAVIESVYGLNQGLVDGDVEPDRWFLDRNTGHILASVAATRENMVVSAAEGVTIQQIQLSGRRRAP